jgi:hypothetical protein
LIGKKTNPLDEPPTALRRSCHLCFTRNTHLCSILHMGCLYGSWYALYMGCLYGSWCALYMGCLYGSWYALYMGCLYGSWYAHLEF